ncbi:MAG: 50S ribosomal protein L6 [Bacteroidetes bacterium]|nr:50S ribosomal protein L6 [Bacteroidota bacterium]
MSRIGNNPVAIPSGVEITVGDNNLVTVKGPKGTLTQKVDGDLIIKIEDGQLTVARPSEQKRHKAMHGLYRSLISNMVVGVSEGYVKELELIGVGYRASNAGQLLQLMVGYSHPIHIALPNEVKLSTETVKGKPPRVKLESIDKQLIGQVAAKIRSMRKPEPYKGKGIKFVGEELRRKAGKTAAK